MQPDIAKVEVQLLYFLDYLVVVGSYLELASLSVFFVDTCQPKQYLSKVFQINTTLGSTYTFLSVLDLDYIKW